MKVENEIRKLFKKRHLGNLLQFLKTDEDYQLIREEIILTQDELKHPLSAIEKSYRS
ncbi:hypothetical protein LHM76_001433 [Listeria monocytogenes]|nr:hypothetical protein [Listeria monocytogenes]EII4616119.1 hypothetical protein [Listeria monocytogenes]